MLEELEPFSPPQLLAGHENVILKTKDVPSQMFPPWRESQLSCKPGHPGLAPGRLGPLPSISIVPMAMAPPASEFKCLSHVLRYSGSLLPCYPGGYNYKFLGGFRGKLIPSYPSTHPDLTLYAALEGSDGGGT